MTLLLRFALVAASLLAIKPAFAAGISLDLNRLESQGGNCRATLVVVNGAAATAEALKADLVIFGTDGVVARRLAVDLGPIPAGKTVVKVFDIPATGCAAIGSILLNELPLCRITGDAAISSACLETMTVTSRAGTRFFK